MNDSIEQLLASESLAPKRFYPGAQRRAKTIETPSITPQEIERELGRL